MRVNNIYPAIQGEGCLVGTPMVLVRLQGCNLRCSFCDTKETWDPNGGEEMLVPEIVARVRESTTGHRWVLLTGGEPALQDINVLIDALHGAGYRVAVETNGMFPLGGDPDWVCVSPKNNQASFEGADEVKYVVKDRVPVWVPDGPVILLQPESQDLAATTLCIKTVQERGWRLSIQIHKYLNLP